MTASDWRTIDTAPSAFEEWYLIWSVDWKQWWRADKSGYSPSISDAGRYTRDEAETICNRPAHRCGFTNVGPSEVMLLAPESVDVPRRAAIAEAAAVARSWCDPETGVGGCACAYGEGQMCSAPDGIADAIKRLEER